MVMYETWSLGHKPFEGLHIEKVRMVMFLFCTESERPVASQL